MWRGECCAVHSTINYINLLAVKMIRLISNFMMSQPGKQTIAIHILPDISRTKGKRIWSQKRTWSVNRIW